MYDTMRRGHARIIIALDMYNAVSSWRNCSENNKNAKHRRHTHLFSATGLLKYVAMIVLGPLVMNTKGNQHVLIITAR